MKMVFWEGSVMAVVKESVIQERTAGVSGKTSSIAPGKALYHISIRDGMSAGVAREMVKGIMSLCCKIC